jgi:hypothetical protein
MDDDLFMTRSGQDRLTNGSSLILQHAWDASDSDSILLRREDSKFEGGQKASRFGAQNGSGKNIGRDDDQFGRNGGRFGRDQSNEKKESLYFKSFTRDLAAPDRLNTWGLTAFTRESSSLTGVDPEEPKNRLGLPLDSTRTTALPPGWGSYAPLDSRQPDPQAGAVQGYGRAWEPPADTRPAVPKGNSNPNQIIPSRVVAPKRPINLPMPKRPSDPNPY